MPQLANVNSCTGCSACASVCPASCISMIESAEGFYVPKVNESSCVNCGLCEKICPQLNHTETNHKPVSVMAAWSSDEQSRRKSSSGAAFYEIAARFIEDGGVVFGVINDNGLIRHRSTAAIDELEKMRGSKYVQSLIGNSFKEVRCLLKDGKKVLFSGTPCQIAGLKSYIGSHNMDNLYSIDLICHGVPPAGLFKNYFGYLSKRFGEISSKDYMFRITDGWDVRPLLRINGRYETLKDMDASFMELFMHSAVYNECCYKCHYANISRTGDLSIGDFWGIGKNIPFNEDTSGGCSLILVNSVKGQKLLKEQGGGLHTVERSLEEALTVNTNLHSASPRPGWRNNIFREIERLGIENVYLLHVFIPLMIPRAYRKVHHMLHLLKIRICRK